MLKRISRGLLLICFVLPILSLFISEQAFAAEENVEIIMHKRVLREADLAEFDFYQNDGHETDQDADIIKKTDALGGAIFDVYDITQLYQESVSANESLLDQINEISCTYAIDYLQSNGYKPILKDLKTNTEAEDGGVLRFTVPKYNKTLQSNAAYLIVETGIDPAAGVSIDLDQTRPLAVVLPVIDPISGQEMKQIHLYPKNISQMTSPYFFKIGKKLDGTEVPLAGVTFVLYRKDETGNKAYLAANPSTELTDRWTPSSDPKNDSKLSRFTSDSNGLVLMEQQALSAGTYYLEEIQGIEGYKVEEEDKEIPVVIPETKTDAEGNPSKVLINEQPMEAYNADGSISDEVMSKKVPRIYNQEEKQPTLPQTEGKVATSASRTPEETLASRLLPQTGSERVLSLTLLGLLLIGMFLYFKRKQLNNK